MSSLHNAARAIYAALPVPVQHRVRDWRQQLLRRRLNSPRRIASARNADGSINQSEIRRRVELALLQDDRVAALLSPVDDLPETPDLIHAITFEDALSERALNTLLTLLFATRDFDRLVALVQDAGLRHDGLRAYHAAWLARHRAEPAGRFDAVLAAFDAHTPTGLVRRRFLTLLVLQASNEARCDWLSEYFAEAPVQDIADLPPRILYGAVAILIHEGHTTQARDLLDRVLPRLSPLSRLMLLHPARQVLGPSHEPGLRTQLDLLERLGDIRRAHLNLRAEPAWDWLLATFRKVQDSAAENLMDMRTQPEQIDRFDQLVLDALTAKRPLSFVRLGDGESYRMPVPPDLNITPAQMADDAAVREKAWWNVAIPPKKAEAMVERMRQATRTADILGVPTAYRMVNDAVLSGPYGTVRNDRAMVQLLHHITSEADLDRLIVTEESANQRVFSRDRLLRYAHAAQRVIFVGCWTREALGFPPEIQTTWILVRPSNKLTLDMPPEARFIVDDYPAIAAEVAAAAAPGALLLLAAGYASKGLAATARGQGAVALDVGAAVDRMAGAHTRLLTGIL